jgi:hypothetical protein
VNTDLNLDGLTANSEQSKDSTTPLLRRSIRVPGTQGSAACGSWNSSAAAKATGPSSQRRASPPREHTAERCQVFDEAMKPLEAHAQLGSHGRFDPVERAFSFHSPLNRANRT